MSDYAETVRRRRQNLLIVEGNHEKNEFFWLIFRCFPEINVNMDDVWIYGTNIYMLYDDIVREYGNDWKEDDIDLPFVISKKKDFSLLRYKDEFINIILVFDYERHDPNFSESKILNMQSYFVDPADTGKLYINYPMIESYRHLLSLPDPGYAERKIPVSLQPGSRYKGMVRSDTLIAGYIEFPHKVEELLQKRYGISDSQIRSMCYEAILSFSNGMELDVQLQNILQGAVDTEKLKTAQYQFRKLITDLDYIHKGQSYWECMRKIFQQIIFHNICKANRIQNGEYYIDKGEFRQCFEKIDLIEILNIQNNASQDLSTGFIWVLNTCILLIAEYNFRLATE